MTNWEKTGVALIMCLAVSGCKTWNCGCPMSSVEVEALPVAGCTLAIPSVEGGPAIDTGHTNNQQPATGN